MNTVPLHEPRILDEDLQIVHATLAAILDDVQHYSRDAGERVMAAMSQVYAAQHTMARLRDGE